MTLSHKTMSFEVKSLDDTGHFSLYAAAFGNRDRQGEIITPGAFKNLDEFVKDGWGAVNHTNFGGDLGVAMIDSATQDAKGLLISGVFHSTDDAQRIRTKVRERMERGKSVKCSIGYQVTDGDHETKDGQPVYVIKSLNVYEFSFVNMPANPEASVMSAKSENGATPRTFGRKVIRHEDGKWNLYDHTGKHRLSSHATRADAVAQEQAIEIHKHDEKGVGDHVLLAKDYGGGCGTVISMHKAGMVPDVHGDSVEGTEEEPAARVALHDKDHGPTGAHKAVPMKHLKRIDQAPDAPQSDDTMKSIGGLATMPSLDEFSHQLVADMGEFAGLMRKFHDLRTKAGRTLSEANRRRIKAACEAAKPLMVAMKDLEDLHAETEPEMAKDAEPDAGDPNEAYEGEGEGEKAARSLLIQRLQLEAAALEL